MHHRDYLAVLLLTHQKTPETHLSILLSSDTQCPAKGLEAALKFLTPLKLILENSC